MPRDFAAEKRRLIDEVVKWESEHRLRMAVESALDAYADLVGQEKDEEIAALRTDREWQPIETAPKRRKVMVGWTNELGKWRTTLATFYEVGDIELDESPDDWIDEDGKNTVAGWWEDSQTREEWYLDEKPIHWMPLPAALKEVPVADITAEQLRKDADEEDRLSSKAAKYGTDRISDGPFLRQVASQLEADAQRIDAQIKTTTEWHVRARELEARCKDLELERDEQRELVTFWRTKYNMLKGESS